MTIPTNSILLRVQQTTQRVNENIQNIEKSNATGKRNLQDMASSDLILASRNSIENSTLQGISNAISEFIDYASTALHSTEAIAEYIPTLLELANAACDPSRKADLNALHEQCKAILQQIQNTVKTTHDVRGNLMLDGSIANYGATAAADIATIVGTAPVMQAANANAANNALKAAFPNLSASENQRLDNAARAAVAKEGNAFGSVPAYIAEAMAIIPTIGVDSAQLNAQLPDAIRAARIGELLGAPNDGPIAKSIAAAQGIELSTLVAHLVNAPAGTGAGAAAAPAGQAAGIAAGIAALLTPAEKESLLNLVGANAAAGGAAVQNQISGLEFHNVFSLIQCFNNIPGFLNPNGAPNALSGALNNGNINLGAVFPVGAKNALSAYITTAATNRVNNATPQTVPVGPGATTGTYDTYSLQFNDMSPTALGLNNLNLSSLANAQEAVTLLTNALRYISGSQSRINNQISDLENRKEYVDTQLYGSIESYNRITNTDPLENAQKVAEYTNTVQTAAQLLMVQQQISNSLNKAAERIIGV